VARRGGALANQFLILGIDESASPDQIDEAYKYLSSNLHPTAFPAGSPAEQQAQVCWQRIVTAYQALRDTPTRERAREQALAERAQGFKPDELKPFLGHICVAAGIITLDDLLEAIDKQGDIDLPLGQILQEKQLLSQTELDGLLMGQRLFGAPNRPPDEITQRLIALGVVSKDMVKIVMIDQRTAYGTTLPQLLVKRGWIAEPVVKVIADQPAATSSNV
jgi:hypothetical protein